MNYFPNNLKVYTKIIMNDSITKTSYPMSIYFLIFVFNIIRKKI